jgi:peroxiredoxin
MPVFPQTPTGCQMVLRGGFMNRKHIFSLLISILLVLFFSFPVFALEPGTPAPDFQLKTLDGQDARLSDYRGQLVLLKLATTWCPTCKQATEEICDLSNFLSKNNVVVIEVFLQDSETMVRDYTRNRDYKNLQHVILLDDGQVMKEYDVYLIPRILFLDQELLVQRDATMMPGREIVKQIEKMLAQSAQAEKDAGAKAN